METSTGMIDYHLEGHMEGGFYEITITRKNSWGAGSINWTVRQPFGCEQAGKARSRAQSSQERVNSAKSPLPNHLQPLRRGHF